jgi:hypothetical protein
MSENVFADEWRECLRAHYMHVIRTKDKVTEPSLTVVMHSAGFNDTELGELRVRATQHVDDVGADFVPDLNVLDTPPPTEPPIFAVPVDLAPALEAPTAEMIGDEVLDPVEAVVEPEPIDQAQVEDLPLEEAGESQEPDEDEPQQLSLF